MGKKSRFGLLLIAFAMLAGCAGRNVATAPKKKPPENADHSITLTWQQSFANNPPCSSTVTTSCISGFNLGYISGTNTQNQLHTETTAGCTGTTQPENCSSTFNGILPIGSIVFYAVTTGIDKNGAAVSSTVALSPAVTVGADSASNVSATINN